MKYIQVAVPDGMGAEDARGIIMDVLSFVLKRAVKGKNHELVASLLETMMAQEQESPDARRAAR